MHTKLIKAITSRPRRKMLGIIFTTALCLLVAGIAFAAPVMLVDDQGADDYPGQKDLNFLTVDYAPGTPGTIKVSWGWDDTAWSGNNTGDACTLFDTDADGFANYSLCVTVGGSPATYQSTRLYSCGDTRSDRCDQPTTLIASFTSSATASVVANSDPFGVPASPYYNSNHVTGNTCGDRPGCYTADTVADVTIALSDFGGSNAKLINVCSYPSQEPNSAPSECVITPNNGFLTIVKAADPDDGTGFTFNLGAGQTSQNGTSSWTINGSGSVQLISFAPGTTYDLSEVVPSGWQLDSASCEIQTSPTTSTGSFSSDTVTDFEIRSGLETICTFNDSLAQGTLIVKKVVVNDNGGTLAADDFSFSVDGGTAIAFEADGQNDLTVDAGTYSVTEQAVSGYTTSYDNCTDVVVPPGGSATCTITNDDQAATLIVKKVVVNDNGGTLAASDFSFSVNGGTAVAFEADGQNDLTVDAGTYSVTEPAVSGYTTSYNNCSNLVIPNGGSATCTITNDDQAATLIVKKVVVNDNGGTLAADDFSFSVDGGTAVAFESDGQNDLTVDAGTYSVTEPAVSGYTTTYNNCSNVVIPNGGTATCTITNDDQAATLIVKKVVINDNGGTLAADDFSFSVDGGTAVAFEADGQNDLAVDAGSHSVIELAVSGYTTSYENCTDVVVPPGGSATCTITNDDIQPLLTVSKAVVNDNGGTAVVADFPLFVDQTSVTSGVQNGFDAGSYTVSETQKAGYTASNWGGDCAADGSITLEVGGVYECTITNDDIQPLLTVTKTVVNDNGGTAAVADFPLFVGQASVDSGVQNGFDAGSYTVSETQKDGYTALDWGGDCATDGSITLEVGGVYECTITNDDQAATLIVKKVVVNDNGGSLAADDFLFSVNGGAAVTFEADGQNDLTVDAGTYSITEPAVSGYTTSYDNCSNVVIPNGGTATCTITNDDAAATLIVKKVVVNNNGGTLQAQNFSFSVNGGTAVAFEADGENQLSVAAGTYSIIEPAVSGYTTSYDNCSNLVIPNGGSATCTITNDDQAATLIVKKVVVNNNGGTAVASNFSFSVNGGTAVAFEADGQNDLTVDAGTYSVTEPAVSGYSTTSDNCSNLVIPNGGSATCTITNDDQAATLIVKKVVVNDNGGSLNADDFSFSVNGGTAVAFEADGQNDLTVDAGTYSVTEPAVSGYTTSYDNCSNVVIPNGGSATCTITNDDQAATLIVKKVVVNDNGGSLSAENFSFSVNGGTAVTFEADGENQLSVAAGTYSVTEPAVSGYTTSYDNCSNLVIPNGGSATCTITNDDQAATLIVQKVVVNNNGGTAVASNFSFSVNGGTAVAFEADGENQLSVAAGTYSVTEPAVSGYSTTYNNCSNLVIPNGGSATCTITNDDIPPQVSQITPTGTTCTQFNSGTAATLSQLQYSVKGGKISQVNPGVFFYWVKVSATAGSNNVAINQAITTGNFNTFYKFASGSNVFTSSCVAVKPAAKITQSGGSLNITFNAKTAGTYIIGIKFDAKSVVNAGAPTPTTTVHYDFSTVGVPSSTSGLDLVKK